jgi:hypothetical protein
MEKSPVFAELMPSLGWMELISNPRTGRGRVAIGQVINAISN